SFVFRRGPDLSILYGEIRRMLKKGVPALSRSAAYFKKHRFSVKKGPVAEKKAPEVAPVCTVKESKFYAAERIAKPLPSRRNKQNPTKLRSTITPGTVLIILAGRFKGKRVVFVKQLASGLLLVTGPYQVNGVPLRRVSQAYVIATSTKVDISGVDAASIDDAFFAKEESAKKQSEEFFGTEKEEKKVSQKRKDAQNQVDSAIITAMGKNSIMRSYLKTHFSLTKGQFPHLMKF
ncbi:hypothetical protein BVRB_022150, partial [Beta vulgaris subsp. vulgaris]